MKKIILVIWLLSIFVFLPRVIAQSVSPDSGQPTQVSGNFVIDGKITNADKSSFELAGDIIAVPTDLDTKLSLNGVIKNNNTVQVKGVVSNGLKVATDIRLINKPVNMTETNQNLVGSFINGVKNFFSQF